MAIGKVKASSEGGNIKRFVGVGSFRVIGVNLNKEKLSDFYGRTVEKDQVYVTDKVDESDGNKAYKQARISFAVVADKLNEEGKEIKTNAGLAEDFKTTVNFFIDSRYTYNKDKTKVKVLDKYNRSAWVTVEQAKNHQIPVYSNGPANIDKDYRPCLRGEEELTDFIINYLNIAPVMFMANNEWKTVDNPEDSECALEHIKDYFKGDFSELTEICNLIPTNRIKLVVGVKTAENGNQYESIFTTKTLRNGTSNYNRITTIVRDRQTAGVDASVFYDAAKVITDIHEYVQEEVKETKFDDPFASPSPAPGEDAMPWDNVA